MFITLLFHLTIAQWGPFSSCSGTFRWILLLMNIMWNDQKTKRALSSIVTCNFWTLVHEMCRLLQQPYMTAGSINWNHCITHSTCFRHQHAVPVQGWAELIQPVGVCGVTQFGQSIHPLHNDLQHVADFPQHAARLLAAKHWKTDRYCETNITSVNHGAAVSFWREE